MAAPILKSLYVENYKQKLRGSTVVAAGNDRVRVELDTPNPGDHWFIERVAIHSDTANDSAIFRLLVGDDPGRGTDFSAMMLVSGCPADDADGLGPPAYVAPGEPIALLWRSMNAGDEVWYNVQVSVCTLISAEVPVPLKFASFALNVDRGPT